jgi:serine/threonine protein kinase
MSQILTAKDNTHLSQVVVKLSDEESFEHELTMFEHLKGNGGVVPLKRKFAPRALVMEWGQPFPQYAQELVRPLKPELARIIYRGVAKCLRKIHERNICHNDFNPTQVIVTGKASDNFYVVDLDHARVMGTPVPPPNSTHYVASYTAPEVVYARTQGSHMTLACHVKHDVWAFGLFAYEILMGEPFFESDAAAQDTLLQLWDNVDFSLVALFPHKFAVIRERHKRMTYALESILIHESRRVGSMQEVIEILELDQIPKLPAYLVKMANDLSTITSSLQTMSTKQDSIKGELLHAVKASAVSILSTHRDVYPRLCVMLPELEEDLDWWQLGAKWDKFAHDKFRLFFLCEFECTIVGQRHRCWHRTSHPGILIESLTAKMAPVASFFASTLHCLSGVSRVARVLGINLVDEIDQKAAALDSALTRTQQHLAAVSSDADSADATSYTHGSPERLSGATLLSVKQLVETSCHEFGGTVGDLQTGLFELFQIAILTSGPHGAAGSVNFYCEKHAQLAAQWEEGTLSDTQFIETALAISPSLDETAVLQQISGDCGSAADAATPAYKCVLESDETLKGARAVDNDSSNADKLMPHQPFSSKHHSVLFVEDPHLTHILDSMRNDAPPTLTSHTTGLEALCECTTFQLGALNQHGGIPVVLTAMKHFETEPAIQQLACRLLSKLATLHQLRGEDVLPTVLTAMRTHPNHASVQEWACAFLAGYATDWNADSNSPHPNVPIQEQTVTAGGLHLVQTALATHVANARTASQACMALASLSCGHVLHQNALVLTGGVLAVMTAMRTYTSTGDVQAACCQALYALATGNRAASATITTAGGPDLIVACLREHTLDMSACIWACAALGTLSGSEQPDHQTVIADAGGLHAVVQALRSHPSSAEVAHRACAAVYALSVKHPANQKTLKSIAGVHGLIVQAKDKFPDHNGVQEMTLAAQKAADSSCVVS